MKTYIYELIASYKRKDIGFLWELLSVLRMKQQPMNETWGEEEGMGP